MWIEISILHYHSHPFHSDKRSFQLVFGLNFIWTKFCKEYHWSFICQAFKFNLGQFDWRVRSPSQHQFYCGGFRIWRRNMGDIKHNRCHYMQKLKAQLIIWPYMISRCAWDTYGIGLSQRPQLFSRYNVYIVEACEVPMKSPPGNPASCAITYLLNSEQPKSL